MHNASQFSTHEHIYTPQSAGTFENLPAPTAKEVGWAKFLCWEGGTEFDAFFTAASAQVIMPWQFLITSSAYDIACVHAEHTD